MAMDQELKEIFMQTFRSHYLAVPLTTYRDSPDEDRLWEHMGGKSWTNVTCEELERGLEGFTFGAMHPGARIHFIPAMIICALSIEACDATASALSFALKDDSLREEITIALSKHEIDLINSFLLELKQKHLYDFESVKPL